MDNTGQSNDQVPTKVVFQSLVLAQFYAQTFIDILNAARIKSVYMIPHELAINHFFDSVTGFKHTIMMRTENLILFIYGYNHTIRKYIGVQNSIGNYFKREMATRKYPLPLRPCTFIDNYELKDEFQSTNEFMQIPVAPLNTKPLWKRSTLIALPRCMLMHVDVQLTQEELDAFEKQRVEA